MDIRIWNILGNHIKGESSKDEESALADWLAQSQENQQIMADIQSIWEKTGELDTSRWTPKVDIDHEWSAFKSYSKKQAAEDAKSAIAVERERNKYLAFPVWMYRLAAAVILGFGLIYFINYSGSMLDDQEMIVHNSHQQKRKIMLPDKSVVWINRQSQIAYDADFGISHRKMSLKGEAYFDVQKNQIPFVIISQQSKTEVLGTAFNLRAYENEPHTQLTLIRGQVAFSEHKNPDNRVILAPGEKAVLQNASRKIEKSNNLDLNVLSWKEDKISFDNSTMTEVTRTIEKYFDVNIKFSNEQLNACRFTGSFEDPKLDEMLDVICASLQLTYTQSQNIITITGNGCEND